MKRAREIRLPGNRILCLLGVLFLSAVCAKNARALEYKDLPAVPPVISCEQLAQVDVSPAVGAKVTLKTSVLETPKGKYCKVTGNIEPAIGFEVDLPIEHWTQRYAQSGCGAYCGSIRPAINQASSCKPALDGDLAVASDNMGHEGGMGGPQSANREPEGAFGADPQKRIDFAYRANHVTALLSKALIKAYYGQPQKFAYFVGCSDGGREALTEAERFPDDFDGIAAGAPVAIINVHNSFFHNWVTSANKRADGSTIFFSERLGILRSAIVAHCPTLSGLDDGLLADPRACVFDPAWVQCKAGSADTTNCLTAEEIGVVKKTYEGPQDASGKRFEISGLPIGSEGQWRFPSMTPTTSAGPGGGGMSGASLKYLLLPTVPNESPDELSAQFTYSQEWFDKVREMGYLFNAANTNLRPFQQKGGKLLMWHGLADTSVPPAISVAYYQGVQQQLGEKLTDSFLRLFFLPGVGHCGGGDGPAQVDVLTPLMTWTELQQAPTKLMAGKTAGSGFGMGPGPNVVAGGQIVNGAPGGPGGPGGSGQTGRGGPGQAGPGGPGAQAGGQDAPAQARGAAPGGAGQASPGGPGGMGASMPYSQPAQPTTATRPAFPYPYIAHYTGKGDPKNGANFEPVKTPVTLPELFHTEATKLIGPDNQKFYQPKDGKVVETK